MGYEIAPPGSFMEDRQWRLAWRRARARGADVPADRVADEVHLIEQAPYGAIRWSTVSQPVELLLADPALPVNCAWRASADRDRVYVQGMAFAFSDLLAGATGVPVCLLASPLGAPGDLAIGAAFAGVLVACLRLMAWRREQTTRRIPFPEQQTLVRLRRLLAMAERCGAGRAVAVALRSVLWPEHAADQPCDRDEDEVSIADLEAGVGRYEAALAARAVTFGLPSGDFDAAAAPVTSPAGLLDWLDEESMLLESLVAERENRR